MYKKYIIKNGKKIGPYYYTTARQKDGRIRSVYLGREPHRRGTHLDRYALLVAIVFIIGGAFLFDAALRAGIRESFMNTFLSRSNLLTGDFVLERVALDSANISNTTVADERAAREFVVEKVVNMQLTAGAVYSIQMPTNVTLTSLRATGSVSGEGSGALKVENMTFIKWSFLPNETIANESDLLVAGVVPDIAEDVKNESLKGKKQVSQSENHAAIAYFNRSCVETCVLNLTKKTLSLTTAFNGSATVLIKQLTFFLVTSANVSEDEIIVTMKTSEIQKLAQQALLAKKPKKARRSIVQAILESYQNKSVERGPDWVRSCDKGCRMTLFSSSVHVMDVDGTYKPLTEAISLNKVDEKTLRLQWKGYNVTMKIADEVLKDLPGLTTTVEDNIIDYEFIYRYKLDTLATMPVIAIESNKELKYDNKTVYLGDIAISFEDTILFNNFNTTAEPIDKKKVNIKMRKDYRAFNQSIGDEIEIDPTIRLSGPSVNNTYDNDVDDLGNFGVDTSETMQVGQGACGGQYYRSFIDWNTSLVPDVATVQQVNLTLYFERVGDEPTISITDMNNRSEGRAGSAIYDDAGANAYVSQDVSAGGSQTFVLGATANNAIEKNLSINEFNVGIKSSEDAFCGDCICPNSPSLVTTREGLTAANRPALTVTYNIIPNATLIKPTNMTNFTVVGNITLNGTAIDLGGETLKSVRLYVSNYSNLNNGYPGATHLVQEWRSVSNGTSLEYNISAIPIQDENPASSGALLIYHFDNRTDFGEPQFGRAYDFSGNGLNCTMQNNAAIPNRGKFASGIEPYGLGLGYQCDVGTTNVAGLSGVQNITYLAWVNSTSLTQGFGRIVDHRVAGSPDPKSTGFAIAQIQTNLSLVLNNTRIHAAGFFNTTNIYYHLAVVLRANLTYEIYRDGRLFQSGGYTKFYEQTTQNFVVGATYSFSLGEYGGFFTGVIDDFAIFNRSLTAAEIQNIAQLRNDTYYWYMNLTDISNVNGASEVRIFNLLSPSAPTVDTQRPSWYNVTLNESTTGILRNRWVIFNTTWTDDTALHGFIFSINQSLTFINSSYIPFVGTWNMSFNISQITAPRGTNVSWRFYANDTSGNWNETQIQTFVVANTPPEIPQLLEPTHGNVTINVRPRFRWTAVDADNDTLTFGLSIICYNGTSNVKCPYTGDDRNVTIIASTVSGNATILPNNFLYYKDDNFYYNWTVNATDGFNATSRAQPNNFSIAVVVDLSVYIQNASFGQKNINDQDDTLDLAPYPIKIQNNGNARVSITIANEEPYSLFIDPGRPAFSYQIAANETDNDIPSGDFGITFNYNAFNQTSSLTTFTNYPDGGGTINDFIRFFNFSTNSNITAIHLNITVPSNEPPGNKNSTMTIQAAYGGYI